MMYSKLSQFCLALFALVLWCGGELGVVAYKRKMKFCKLDNLFECFNEPIAFFTAQPNGTGIAANDEQYEQYCFNQHDYLPYCATQWAKRCGSQMHVEVLKRLVLDPMQQSMKKFCDSKGTIRPYFLEHANCLIEHVKLASSYRGSCVREMQANNEYIHSMAMANPNLTSYMTGLCCAYNQWEQCIMGFMKDKCGVDSAEIVPYLIHHTSMDYMRTLCPQTRFDPTSTQACPPPVWKAPSDLVPLGYNSHSAVSHYFSYLCPNVGWGLGNADF